MIYLVEDDDSIRELVLYTLHTTGFEAEGFRNAADFWQALEKELPQLVLLDIMLPDEDGLHILKRLRAGAETADLPVMMLTAKSSEYDRVVGLDSGADGEPVILTYKEFELLCYLLENRGVVLSRDQILTKIWDYNYSGETRTVDVHIRTLRQKLGDAGALIETVRGEGYRLAQD